MNDAGLEQRLQDDRVRVALDRVERPARKALEKARRGLTQRGGLDAIDRIAGPEHGNHRLGRSEMPDCHRAANLA